MVSFLWKNFFKQKEKSVKERLRSSYIFQDLTSKELKQIEDFAHIREYRPQETIFARGDMALGIYIVIKGTVNIFLETNTNNHSSKPDSPIVQLTESDYMGEISLIEKNSYRTATAAAEGNVVLMGFFKPDLDEIVRRKPSLGLKIMIRIAESLAKRIKETSIKMLQLKKEMKNYNL